MPLGALTVMIGANAAGKSNAIEALRLLSWLAQGHKLSTIRYGGYEPVVRGRIEDLFHRGSDDFSLGCLSDDEDWHRLSLRIGWRDGDLHIQQETVDQLGGRVPLYLLDRPSVGMSTDAGVAYNNFAKGGTKPHVTVSDQMAVFTQLDSPARFEAGHRKAQEVIPVVARRYQRLLSDIVFLDPVPARMREYSFTNDRRLRGDGSHLSSVLHHLWGTDSQAHDEPVRSQREEMLAFIQSLPEQEITGLAFLTGPRGEVMVQLQETFGGLCRWVDASLLSDGTLRVLAIAAAMLSAPQGSLVVIEEIDNGVHPSRAHHLLERLRTLAQQRQLRVLLSTHNPALLDALPDAAVPDVVFCYRDPADGASRLVRLSDVPDVPELLVQGPLGRLMSTGILDRFIKQHPGPETRRQQARAWLASLRLSGEEVRL
ncbi:hypothetical protein VITFI_CDS2589 [Vitreoscilla filiformis]|uniref:ATPase AAA-type core domain-containing protein n=1 Tax=Vitreoscilla filiformis TaxID=63 RepID=A0A221KH77_VITFI|nr:hypothetical protein VITFI_CDS2589 [Vitreoscilla filiformis]